MFVITIIITAIVKIGGGADVHGAVYLHEC